MRAPKCKLCGAEHWGLCYVQPRAIKAVVAKVAAPKPKAKPAPKSKKTKTKKAASNVGE